ncbi:MAG: hypothetical protein ACYC6Y_19610 [Thermoguttaceae bacterium]
MGFGKVFEGLSLMSKSRLLVFILGGWLISGALATTGCSPRLTEEDLGQLQTQPSQLPGSGQKYDLPEPDSSKNEMGSPSEEGEATNPTNDDANLAPSEKVESHS